MAETEFINKSFSLTAETIRRLQIMSTASERSDSAMVRHLINQEWERKYGTGPLSAAPGDEGKEQ